jgi:hypothetical protein
MLTVCNQGFTYAAKYLQASLTNAGSQPCRCTRREGKSTKLQRMRIEPNPSLHSSLGLPSVTQLRLGEILLRVYHVGSHWDRSDVITSPQTYVGW